MVTFNRQQQTISSSQSLLWLNYKNYSVGKNCQKEEIRNLWQAKRKKLYSKSVKSTLRASMEVFKGNYFHN